ncbi:2-oxoacid:acceptor oxidoreductase family protein, partial [Enterococcus sp. S181_ASV_20]|nr:2-oxoacid:acceptor oxidoreductase family protein [Enterococcus sp. S181_ASV_20]
MCIRDSGGTFLLNTVWDEEKVKQLLPNRLKRYLADHKINFYIINAMDIAQKTGLGGRINQVMSTAFFELTDIMDHETYLPLLKAEVDAAV